MVRSKRASPSQKSLQQHYANKQQPWASCLAQHTPSKLGGNEFSAREVGLMMTLMVVFAWCCNSFKHCRGYFADNAAVSNISLLSLWKVSRANPPPPPPQPKREKENSISSLFILCCSSARARDLYAKPDLFLSAQRAQKSDTREPTDRHTTVTMKDLQRQRKGVPGTVERSDMIGCVNIYLDSNHKTLFYLAVYNLNSQNAVYAGQRQQ